ncbi:virulence-associated E family protein [Dichelobacter nodosus]|uniref:virulence-associated E family protein n=1 Tax=Dichelobacter nodosus TaxID=870 RepID=UPI000E296DBE|nr:virulence-associated E family protein [Dichelobacter nodosus]AXM45178.1 virulence-associated protein VapE1 [Dichelobacter nodosus]
MNCEKITPLNESFPDIEFVIEREKVAKDYRNVIAFFTQDESLVDSIAFNTLSNRVVFTRNMPWRKCSDVRNGTEWTDSDTLNFIRHAGDNYRVIFRVETVDHAIMMLAQERRFCPIQKYLDQLQWDGIPRIYNVFADFLGVERNAYTIEVSSLFFRAAVTRAYRPGCQFDHVIILQGAQGIGKSSFLRILGGDWYSSSIRKFEGKEAIEALNGVLIGEIPELQGFSKAEVEEIKAFITRTEDSVRPAYGRWVEHSPRRTLFVGTTNDDDYLRDSTGNRRFFPIICTKALDFKALEAARDQLFAEAVALYHSMPNYPLTLHSPEARALAKQAQEEANYHDPWEDIILPWLDKEIRADHWECEAGEYPPCDGHTAQWVMRDRVATLEIWCECLKFPIEKMTTPNSKRIANIMRRSGWIRGNYRYGERYPASRGYIKRL